MKDSRRAPDTFQSQLQHKLSSLVQTKSHKKIKIKHPLDHHNYYKCELDQFSNINENTSVNDQRASQISDHSSPNTNPHQKEIPILSMEGNKKKQKQVRKQHVIEIAQVPKESKKGALDLIQNNQVRTFLQANFGQKCDDLDVSYFLAKCLAQFSRHPSLPQEQIKIIFLELQQEITTTDPNAISLNALELAVKKSYGSFELYVGSKIVSSQQQLINRKLKLKQKQLDKQISQGQKERQIKQKQLQQTQKMLAQRQKQVSKKQKSLQNKEKQFMDRLKNHKKMLEQRAQKLTEEYAAKLQSVCEKIEKKINTYERTMKYRVQSMNHKINEIHHLRQFKQGEIRNSVVKDVDEKYEKIYGSKMRKYEGECKQLMEKCEAWRKQCKELQEENNKLASIVGKMEGKVAREEAKIKQLVEEVGSRKEEVKQLQYLCTEKQKQNEKLIKKLVVHKEEQQAEGADKSYGQGKMKSSQSKKSLSSRKKINKGGETADAENVGQIELKEVIEVYEVTLNAINKNGDCRLSQQIVAKSLLLLVRIITYQSVSCQFLLELTFDNMLRMACQQFIQNEPSSKKQTKSSIKLNQLGQIEPVLSQHLQKYLKWQKKQKKQNRNQNLWKLWCMVYILSSSINNKAYLNQIYAQSQNSPILSQMQQNLSNSEYNFIYAVIIKYVNQTNNHNEEVNLNTLTLLTDLVLDFKIVGEAKFDRFWKFVGHHVIRCFLLLVKCTINDTKYFHEFYDAIEKISIMVQRLVVAHQVPVPIQSEQIFQTLSKKCRGSLLERNLNSILESMGPPSNFLAQLQKQ